MDTEKQTQEEIAAEEAATQELKEDEVRTKVVEDFGFDAEDEDDKAKIDKIVADKMESHKKLSKAIGQKRKFRTDFREYQEKNPEKKAPKEPKEPEVAPKEQGLSDKDMFALINAKTPEDDLDDIKKFARVQGITVVEALKDPILQAILADKAEKRASAEATDTKNKRPSGKKLTDAEVLDKARKGEIPEAGTQEAEDLFYARRGGRRE